MASTIPPRLLDSSKSTIVPLADVPAHLSTFLHSIEDPEMVSRLQGIVDCIEGEVGGVVDFAALIKGGEKRKVEEDEEEVRMMVAREANRRISRLRLSR